MSFCSWPACYRLPAVSRSKSESVRQLLSAHPRRGRLDLTALNPSKTHGLKRRVAGESAQSDEQRIMALQDRLFAEHRHSLLIVLQGMDTSGKDGTIRHILRALNPQGVRVVPFKAPTPTERKHDFLWRIKLQLPKPGQIVISNRSHYEDVLIAKVRELASPSTIDARYDRINRFEADLVKSGTTVLKFFLHISLLDRLGEPDKHWKVSPGDLTERRYWSDYQQAYASVLARCSTPVAPWFVIPSNRKWYRDWAISQILIETLEAMHLTYPDPHLNVATLKKQLNGVH
jgi:PPK2 family polyphosphate:nucleotide phosphotransferase